MKLYYAHYPALEERFVQFVRQRRSGPADKWLVVCSSSYLTHHLQTRLAKQWGALANMHFLTGSALIEQLDRQAPGPADPILPQNHLRDFLIKEILQEPGLNRYPISRGFVQAVKSALRDLADSLADPDILLEHWRTMPDFVIEQDGGRFEWLIRVYKRYQEKESCVPGYRSYQQVFERVLKQVEDSVYLQGFSQIILYGFYDMPGRLLELFNTLRAHYPVTVFAPYQNHPAYQFAKPFFETNWLSSSGAEDAEQPVLTAFAQNATYLFTGEGSAPAPQVTITQTADPQSSVFYTAKEILKCIAQGTAPADIAIIARNLLPYQEAIRQIFQENYIPLDASFTYPFAHYALGKFCLNLLGLATRGFAREHVLAIFSSPYFKQSDKANWQYCTTRSLVNRDLAQWHDLLPDCACKPNLLAWLDHTANTLAQLSRPQPWQEGVQQVLAFLAEQIDTEAFEGKDAELYRALQDNISLITQYATIRKNCRAEELLPEITQALTTLTFHEAQAIRGGITVTDALRARGLSFKKVFILGLNDKEFPLITPEDPLLRDYYRHLLRNTLGYWINPSLDRASEEKLLFYTALTAAREHLYILYSRRTTDGKPAVPSLYLTELARCCQIDLQSARVQRLSGRLSVRLSAYPLTLLSKREVLLQGALHPLVQTYYRQAGLLTPDTERSLIAAQTLNRFGPLSAYDGLVAHAHDLFLRENKRGFSPSGLQKIAACPLQYFFHYGLELAEPETPSSRSLLAPHEKGNLYHRILKNFYQTLYQHHTTHALLNEGLTQQLTQCIAAHYTHSSYRLFGMYPVVWELFLETLQEKLTDFILKDVAQLGPFTPSLFEWEVQAEPTHEVPLRLRGIIDRVDLEETTHQFYIADYKSTRKGSADLAHDFFTQLLFQPVLYIYLAQQQPALAKNQAAGSYLLSISPYSKRELSYEEYQVIWPRVCGFLTQLIDFMKTGTFFINPSKNCTYCPYALLCRKDAFKPLLRARKSAAFKSLEEARQ